MGRRRPAPHSSSRLLGCSILGSGPFHGHLAPVMPEALLCTERLLRFLLCACVSRPPRLHQTRLQLTVRPPQAVRPHSKAPRPAFCLAAGSWSASAAPEKIVGLALCSLHRPACLLETNFCNKLVRSGWVGGRGPSARLTSCPSSETGPSWPLPISISMQDMKWVCLSVHLSVRLCKGLG